MVRNRDVPGFVSLGFDRKPINVVYSCGQCIGLWGSGKTRLRLAFRLELGIGSGDA